MRAEKNIAMGVALLLVISLCIWGRETEAAVDANQGEKSDIFAATVPCGYEGIINGILSTKGLARNHTAIGTDCEKVLVGQRLIKVDNITRLDIGQQMEETVEALDNQSYEMASTTTMSDEDYQNLLAIVEAEAGGEDIEGRILVANVVLNRVKSPDYPADVTSVIWQRTGGSAQFTPTADGSIYSQQISDKTREAVNRAIDGEDLSQGALNFISKHREGTSVFYWFEDTYTFLFEHGGHRFYK